MKHKSTLPKKDLYKDIPLNITEIMAGLVLQIGVIVFAVRGGAALARKLGIPSVLGELLAGIATGPYALGCVPLPGFPNGLFAPPEMALAGSGAVVVSSELYAFSAVGSIILLFASGLETDIALFLRYSVAGGLIGICGVLVSFVTGALTGCFFLNASFMDVRCLFFGVLSTATSVGITARILSGHKKMDSPEGVTILASAVFDDVLGIIILAVVLGVAAVEAGVTGGGEVDGEGIALIAVRAVGIWLVFTAAGLFFSKRIASFLKLFKSSFDFSMLAFGIALLCSGIFEHHGLAMIIGAYVAGLSLSKTDIAAVIQERIRGVYEFFVPIFFAVMGMMVNITEIFSKQVLIFGAVYTAGAVIAKIAGCGLPALALGFNWKGALRIGAGMVPRGEVALIIAGIGLASGVLNNQFFSIIILMTLITTLIAPTFLNIALTIPGHGTRRPSSEGAEQAVWDFNSSEIADLVVDTLLKDLKGEGFYVQMMNIDDGLSQARKGDISLSITEMESTVTITCSKENMSYIKTAMYEVIIELHRNIQNLTENTDAGSMRKELAGLKGNVDTDVLALVEAKCVTLDLKSTTKEDILAELVQILAFKGKIQDYDMVLQDVLEREKTMSTGMEHGVAIPHTKSEGVSKTVVAVGIKKEGVEFQALDNEKSCIFILTISPLKHHNHHLRFLSSIAALLRDTAICEKIKNAQTPEEVAALLKGNAPQSSV
ncbi:MAG: fructose PTS transporter subunit IIA [Spirochaetaceae bacterium]|jgi:fructose-specific phosphotransferase system IIA component|nr:fructose PTS transporter subunit IIA [Spirochaetaceae bacterium]